MASDQPSSAEKPNENMEDVTIETLRQYVCPLTLDPDTASRNVKVSNGDKLASYNHEQNTCIPCREERFKISSQVMCREGLSGRHFCQVEWLGRFATIGLSYKDKKYLASPPGHSENSWAINVAIPSYLHVLHGGIKTKLSKYPPSIIGVYLDWPAGILSFYDIVNDKAELIHTFHTTFTQPLYLVFSISAGLYLLPKNPGPTCGHYHDPWDMLRGYRDCRGCNGAMAE